MNDFFDQHIKIIPVGFPKGTPMPAAIDIVAPLAPPRPLWRIAQDIDAEWVDKNGKPAVWFGAVPYLEAMRDLDKITDSYGADSAKTIVAYFLGNSAQWKGPVAKETKNELRRMIGQKESK